MLALGVFVGIAIPSTCGAKTELMVVTGHGQSLYLGSYHPLSLSFLPPSLPTSLLSSVPPSLPPYLPPFLLPSLPPFLIPSLTPHRLASPWE